MRDRHSKNEMMTDKQAIFKKLTRCVGKTIGDYEMIKPEDKILVAVSGGKDSLAMLHLLMYFQKVSPIRFDLFPVTIDPGFNEFDCSTIEKNYRQIAPFLKWAIVKTDIYKTITQKNTPGKYPCAFCARLRRGVLYRLASENNYNCIALGHHADDAIETVLISSFYQGTMVSLPPVYKPKDHPFKVIRPLIRVWEQEIIKYSCYCQFDVTTCGHSELSAGKRKEIKALLSQIEKNNPKTKKNFLAALHKIQPDHFLDAKWL